MCTHTYIYIHIYIYLSIYLSINIFIYIYIYMFVHIYIYVHIYVFTHIFFLMYMRMVWFGGAVTCWTHLIIENKWKSVTDCLRIIDLQLWPKCLVGRWDLCLQQRREGARVEEEEGPWILSRRIRFRCSVRLKQWRIVEHNPTDSSLEVENTHLRGQLGADFIRILVRSECS